MNDRILQEWRVWRESRQVQSAFVASALAVVAFSTFYLVDKSFTKDPAVLERMLFLRLTLVATVLTFCLIVAIWRDRWVGRYAGHIVAFICCSGVSLLTAVMTAATQSTALGYHDSILLIILAYASLVPTTLTIAGLIYATAILVHVACISFAAPLLLDFGFTNQVATITLGAGLGLTSVGIFSQIKMREIRLSLEALSHIDQLKKADLAKSTFFENVSHSFRQPLMVIDAANDSLQEDLDKEGHNDSRFGTISKNTVRLLHLVDDVLELASLASPTAVLTLTPVNVIALMRKIVAEVSPMLGRKRITIVFNPEVEEVYALANYFTIDRALLNLITNATKFTEDGGSITLGVQRLDGMLRISITDTGKGISDEERPHVFTSYYTGAAGKEVKGGGVGIRLSMCKRTVELHGGQIGIESPGKGTVIWFTLKAFKDDGTGKIKGPGMDAFAREMGWDDWGGQLRNRAEYRLAGIDEVSEQRIIERGASSTPFSVLVVEPDTGVVKWLSVMLSQMYSIWVAANAEEGFDRARRSPPDIILVDTILSRRPGGKAESGYDFLHRLRRDPALKDIPVVLLTQGPESPDEPPGNPKDADDYLVKPFKRKDVRAVISRLLERQQQQFAETSRAVEAARGVVISQMAHEILNPVHYMGVHTSVLDRFGKIVARDAAGAGLDWSARMQSYGTAITGLRSGFKRIEEAVAALRELGKGGESTKKVSLIVSEVVENSLTVTPEAAKVQRSLQSTARARLIPGQVERVILNLILNATQAGGPSCVISVSTRDDVPNHAILIEVADNGPGIDPGIRDKLFESGVTTKATGSGFGLVMCREIVRKHNGEIHVDSTPGEGAVFSIRIPMDVAESPASA